MATATLINRIPALPETPTIQNANILIGDGVNFWVWAAYGITVADTDAQVQVILTANVQTYLAEIAANNEAPLTADQLMQYQDIIDAKKAGDDIVILDAAMIKFKANGDTHDPIFPDNGADPNAPTGYKDVFRPTNGTYAEMTNAVKFAVLGTFAFFVADALLEIMRAVKLLLRIAMRRANSGTSIFKNQ